MPNIGTASYKIDIYICREIFIKKKNNASILKTQWLIFLISIINVDIPDGLITMSEN